MTCQHHPSYQAKRAPRADCLDCWKIWAAKVYAYLKWTQRQLKVERRQLYNAENRLSVINRAVTNRTIEFDRNGRKIRQ